MKDKGQILHKAILFAEKAHRGQKRKGTDVDYLVHPMEVAQILADMGVDDKVVVAGILHDTIEDTDVTEKDIEKEFGKVIAELVMSHTEDKSLSWDERKAMNVSVAKNSTLATRVIVLADAVSNVRSMVRDYEEIGDKLWDRFNESREKEATYYEDLYDALSDLENNYEQTKRYLTEFYEGLIQLFYVLKYDDEKALFYVRRYGVEWSYRGLNGSDLMPLDGEPPKSAKTINLDDWRILMTYAGAKRNLGRVK